MGRTVREPAHEPHEPLCGCAQCQFEHTLALLPVLTAASMLLYYCESLDLVLRQRILDAAFDAARHNDGGVSP